jgi:sugar transferase (PEP-CTERM/EpsH1 system associated)
MRDLLFLSQRLPYPPNKGDKIRSWHIFRHLAQHYRMHLGCFIDDPADWQHAPEMNRHCASSLILPLDPRTARLRSLAAFATGEALTLPYFRRRAMARWVAATAARTKPGVVFVFSSAMAQYVLDLPRGDARLVLDMVDMDSQKWQQYAGRKSWPANWIFRRESRLLHRFERRAAEHFDHTLLVSQAEAALFSRLTPGLGERVGWLDNGVDLDYFSPTAAFPTPFAAGDVPLVFTGTMDYWPNIDAVTWFADAVWPQILARIPAARFAIVGANPSVAVQELGKRPGITVTGRVPDVRPYLAHAALVVVPLRVAQGVQNKVLEAMSMARRVIATPQAAEGIAAQGGRDLIIADGAAGFAAAVLERIGGSPDGSLGSSARQFVERHHDWGENLSQLLALCAEAEANRPDIVSEHALTG